MEPELKAESPLPPERAFVVQFRTEAVLEEWRRAEQGAHEASATSFSAECMEGRVEHVVSGQAVHFHSLEELLAFIGQVLANIRAPPRRKVKKAG